MKKRKINGPTLTGWDNTGLMTFSIQKKHYAYVIDSAHHSWLVRMFRRQPWRAVKFIKEHGYRDFYYERRLNDEQSN